MCTAILTDQTRCDGIDLVRIHGIMQKKNDPHEGVLVRARKDFVQRRRMRRRKKARRAEGQDRKNRESALKVSHDACSFATKQALRDSLRRSRLFETRRETPYILLF